MQVRPEYIVPLVEEFHGKKWPKFNSEKICHIAYGRIQVRDQGLRWPPLSRLWLPTVALCRAVCALAAFLCTQPDEILGA